MLLVPLNSGEEKMLNYALGDAAMQVAKITGLGGRVTADKFGSGLRARRRNEPLRRLARYSLLGTAIALLPMAQGLVDAADGAQFVPLQVSTVPANGDTNPYGVAFVPFGFPQGGPLNHGDILVSNFNNSAGLSGTGTTIVRVTPAGQVSLFFNGNPTNQPPPTLGLTTALGVLTGGFVLVGNVPTTDGMFDSIQTGSLLVINRQGQQIATISDPILLDGPWDLTILDGGASAKVFVSNVLNGTVTRLDLDVGANNVTVKQKVQIAKGYASVPNSAALVLGPTGLAFDPVTGILYVASTADNAIFAIENAAVATQPQLKGKLVYQDNAHLRGPLALAFTPNGNLITTNGDAVNASPTPSENSEIVEFTKSGNFVAQFSIDSAVGAAFGIAVAPLVVLARLAAVDDTRNDLTVFTLSTLSTP
jgi:DNA-binding beta-propeller fold protein YncE